MSLACSIVIPVFNRVDLTAQCLRSLVANTTGVDFEVIIVDNASTDGTPELCAGLGGNAIVIRNEENRGFAAACNQGSAAASSKHLLFLNNDTQPFPGWLPPLLAAVDADPAVGAVGCKLLFPNRTVQHGGVVLVERSEYPRLGAIHMPYEVPEDDPVANLRRDVAVVTAAAMLIRREAFEAAGGFDEGYWNGYEDVDLCLTLGRLGWRILYEPASVLIHHESASGPERFVRTDANIDRLQSKWAGEVTPDFVVGRGGNAYPHPEGIFAQTVAAAQAAS